MPIRYINGYLMKGRLRFEALLEIVYIFSLLGGRFIYGCNIRGLYVMCGFFRGWVSGFDSKGPALFHDSALQS